MILYVDVDDTLVKWHDPVEGNLITEWEANWPVIRYIFHWLWENPEGEVVIWSTGGEEYAQQWAQKILPAYKWEAMEKYDRDPQLGDVFIDDDPMPAYAAVNIHPSQLELAPLSILEMTQ